MRPVWFVLAATLVCSPGAAEERRTTITRQEALDRPVAEIAENVLRQIAEDIHEVGRPTFIGIPRPDRRLRNLAMATRPYASSEGICAATILIVAFSSDAPPSEEGSEVPVQANHFHTRTVYKVIGEAESGLNHFPPDARAEWDRRCRDVGPVIAGETEERDQRTFFEYVGEIQLRHAIGILRTVMSDGAAGRLADLSCAANARDERFCGDPRAELGAITLDDLERVEIIRDRRDPRVFRMRADFHAPANFDGQTLFLEAAFETDSPEYPTRLVRVISASVMRGVIIYD